MQVPVEHVVSELQSLSQARRSPNHTFVLCPFHHEKTPSGRVLHDSSRRGVGSFKCFGCGKYAPWNEVAPLLGMQTYGAKGMAEMDVPKSNPALYERYLFGEAADTATEEDERYPLSESNCLKVGLKDGVWRGYSIDFLRDSIGAQIIRSKGRFYILLPVNIQGKEKGYIRAQLFKPDAKSIPSYLNKTGKWSLDHGLFPFDYAQSIDKTCMVLVEGPRDALRLCQAKIPAVAILGTQSWSDKKSRVLEFAGVTKVVCLMDGDEAGRLATSMLRTGKKNGELIFKPLSKLFEWKEVKLWNVPLPKNHRESKLDPGNMPDSFVESVRNLLWNKE
jgi:CHC2 zinc finger/Toprim-like